MSALISSCCFQLTAYGGSGGPVGQLSDGQNRIGQELPPATFCTTVQGGLMDSYQRGCILTPETSQWQCDAGKSPTLGFSVSCDGSLTYDGNDKFQSCPTGDNDGYNLYITAPAGQAGCVEVTLSAGSCKSNCSLPANSTAPASSTTPSDCPAQLTGPWEFPHLIVPVDQSAPNQAFGTSYNGTLSRTVSTIFNFDVPLSAATKTCTLIFLFPKQADLITSAYTISPDTGVAVNFSALANPATLSTTWVNAPAVAEDFGRQALAPGNSYTIESFACPSGQRVGYKMSLSAGDALSWFQDYNPSPIGLFITVC